MKSRCCIAASICVMLLLVFSAIVHAEEYGTDVSGYLGRTVGEVLQDFPNLYYDSDSGSSDREFLTDGKVCFYYEYIYSDTELPEDKRVICIVLNNSCGAEYRIGQLPGGATYGDEYAYLNGMGYEFQFRTDDMRNFWKDDQGHLMIITRGMWAGACETDYSMILSDDFYEQ